jgi:hypothetical protein
LSRLRAATVIVLVVVAAQVSDSQAQHIGPDCAIRVGGLCQYTCVAPEGYACITFYTLNGPTFSGEWVHEAFVDSNGNYHYGVAACSWNIPLYSIVQLLATGQRYICKDRGRLGFRDWIDVYICCTWRGREEITRVYGSYTPIIIVDPATRDGMRQDTQEWLTLPQYRQSDN